jgi:hypothetical protein
VTTAELTWRIRARTKPRVIRSCPRCDVKREFVSTDRFRINAHQSRVDVWLIFQCIVCKFTWKLTIYTRVLPSDIDRDLFAKFTQNDRATAELYSADEALLRKNGVMVEVPTEYDVDGPQLDWTIDQVRLTLEVEGALSARVEAILAKRLAVSRNELDRLIDSGAITSETKKFPKKLANGVVLILRLAEMRKNSA